MSVCGIDTGSLKSLSYVAWKDIKLEVVPGREMTPEEVDTVVRMLADMLIRYWEEKKPSK